ncbi:SDR family oxidoreductase [Desulfotignum phosphitoxidans]|uniref:TetR/AcrR family transcriptional regulator n=1 Tax=Desulfotignum phosphitoxidans DSM 13687 TaxID=1286635 RepID=S0G1X9_9BACT|nr:SDR family oxidoreductase [Desulfotignum phosphitoxidans]EMS80935.1 TetR/AcrR family transcriptional regulator [Desulfotignum phosphitoxidans DSM 13687]
MRDIPTTVKNKTLVEKRRRQIIMAAIKLFSEKGYHKTTLKELAEESGLSHGNIYDYVGSKEDIFFLIHDFLAESAMETLNKSLENIQDPIVKLRRMVRGEFNLMEQWADAVLLIYQESHIFKGDFLRRLLEKERAHLEKFEVVVNECIAQGHFSDCNARLAANLIKSMIDTWTIKRWDLRGYANPLEAEQLILEMVFNGLLGGTNSSNDSLLKTSGNLMGKTALVVNGGTILGQAISSALMAEGLRLIVQTNNRQGSRKQPSKPETPAINVPICTLEQKTILTASQIQNIEKEHGPIDIYVHDLGIGTTDKSLNEARASDPFAENMHCAHELADYFGTQMAFRRSGRIVYVSPWSWDRHIDSIRFQTTKAGTTALSKAMAAEMAATGVTVNCVVPGYIRAIRPQNIEKQLQNELTEKIPCRRMGDVFDVTSAILFFIGDGAKYTTGQVFYVTGGSN